MGLEHGVSKESRQAAAQFFARIGQVGQASHRCEYTLPLFPLVLILSADGTLAPDAQHLVKWQA